MDYQFKQDIELNVYYFSNGTINLKKSDAMSADYRDIVIENPELYSAFGNMLIDLLKKNGDIWSFKSEILDLIYNYKTKELNEGNNIIKNDVYNVAKRFFDFIAFDISKNPKWFSGLMKYASDIQLTFCIWENNLQIDKNGNVVNENEAKNRAMEFIQSIFDGKNPEKPFEKWEMVHST